MIRPVLTELVLFVAPFAVYAIFLFATRGKVFAGESWPAKVVISLAVVATVLVLGSFVILAHFSGAPPGSTYEPAHLENGKFVPGRAK